jgi:hypothetical protein
MKNAKNFDYDKKKPSSQKKYIIQSETHSKNDDYIQMFKEPPLVKGIEITQDTKNKKSVKTSKSVSRTSLKLNTKIKPKSNSKDKESIISDIKSMNNIGIQIEQEEEKNDNNIPDIIIPSLPDDEIIEPEEPLPEEGKIPNPNFCKNYVYNLLNPSKEEIDPNIYSGVGLGLNKVLLSVQDDLDENKIEIGQEPLNIEDIKKFKLNSSLINSNPNFESSIRIQKIKELNQSKKNLEQKILILNNKINEMEEEANSNIKLDDIEENIKKDKIKGNKQKKELLLSKLNGINEQVKRLVQNEEELTKNKKLNIKEFLENFEKDKEKSEELVKKLNEEKKIREQKMISSIKKSYDIKQKEYEQMKLDEEEKKKKELEKIRLKELEIIRERNRENKDKLNYIRQHANDKPANMSQYLFKALENKYNEKHQKEIQTEIIKKREKMKENSVSLEEIFDFEKKQKELEIKRMIEIEEEKKKLKEQWKLNKDILPKFESNMMQMIKEEEKKNKEKKEIEDAKKKLKQQEIKNYTENINKLYLPKINPSMKKEREDRIKNLEIKNNIQHITKKKNNGRILLKKPDPNKPSKYSWKLKLELDEQDKLNKNNKNNIQKKRAKSAQKHEPLEKLPDYLTEMRLKNTQIIENKSQNKKRNNNNWDKILKNEKGNIFENVEKAKKKVEQLEEKAKMSEKLLENSNEGIDPELQQKVSGYLLDAIKGKLSILENMNQS